MDDMNHNNGDSSPMNNATDLLMQSLFGGTIELSDTEPPEIPPLSPDWSGIIDPFSGSLPFNSPAIGAPSPSPLQIQTYMSSTSRMTIPALEYNTNTPTTEDGDDESITTSSNQSKKRRRAR